ncbi:unnamed protein product [Dicrocoelium dendriticum]|nr:unnamed protein product [Dicrocoelium dendriticum]
MTDAGFFKGTSAEQDARFADKKKKLMKTMKFGDNLSQKVDMARINLDCIRPWVTNRVTELLNFEDEVVCNYVLNQLEERHPDPKEIQINITGFLNSKNARIFLTELWDLLLSAMDNPDGVPAAFLEAKKTEILKRQEDEQRVQLELRRKEEELRARVSTDQVPTTTTQARSAMQATSDNSGGTTNMESSLRKKSEKNSNSRRSHSSSSPSPRRHNSPKRSDKSRDVDHEVRNHISSRHRRRSSRSSSRSSGVDHGHTKRPLREPRHPRRSRSHDSPERLMKKKPAPDSDWRKDLMAGRRRSPPEMPENSYYGYEKRHKDRKRSRERHRDHRRRDDSGSRHTSPVVEYSDGRGHRKHRETKHHEDFEPDSDDRRRRKHRERFPESRSPSRRRAVDERVAIDRANKYHNRRAQWAQEEDDLSVKQEEPRSGKRIARTTLEVPDKRIRRSPEGPSLPPSRVPNRTVEKDSYYCFCYSTEVYSIITQSLLGRNLCGARYGTFVYAVCTRLVGHMLVWRRVGPSGVHVWLSYAPRRLPLPLLTMKMGEAAPPVRKAHAVQVTTADLAKMNQVMRKLAVRNSHPDDQLFNRS